MATEITNRKIALTCHRCNHLWNYTGKNKYIAICPHCRTQVSLRKSRVVSEGNHNVHVQTLTSESTDQVDASRSLNDKKCFTSNYSLGNFDIRELSENNPIKRCHVLEGKHFVVIDKSITDKLSFKSENDEVYFEQTLTPEGLIILRPFIMAR